jgi:hypothetical protein
LHADALRKVRKVRKVFVLMWRIRIFMFHNKKYSISMNRNTSYYAGPVRNFDGSANSQLAQLLALFAQRAFQIRGNERFQFSCQHGVGVARNIFGAQVFDLFVGVQHIAADLVAPGGLFAGSF